MNHKSLTLTLNEALWLHQHLENIFHCPEAVGINKKLIRNKLVSKPRFSKREKLIFTAICPSVRNFKEGCVITTQKEVAALNKKCKGVYFDMEDVLGYEEYFACSPSGKKKFFEYAFSSPCPKKQYTLWKDTARDAAILWSKGHTTKAIQLDKYNWSVNYK